MSEILKRWWVAFVYFVLIVSWFVWCICDPIAGIFGIPLATLSIPVALHSLPPARIRGDK